MNEYPSSGLNPDHPPSRQAKVPIDSDLFATDSQGGIAKDLKAIFKQAFATPIKIMPNKKESFGLDLYVKRRCHYRTPAEVANNPDQGAVDLLCEKQLHKGFWIDGANNNPVQFILGVVGGGKSTLLQYYLHVHCPENCKSLEDYKRKLIVYVNLRNTREEADLKKRLYSEVRSHLLAACKDRAFDLLTADDFAMWRDVMGLQSLAYANWGNHDKEKWVLEKMIKIDDEEFVKLALKYISSKIGNNHDSKFPFSYLVLALDNIDQSPYPVVERAMEIVHEWIEMGLKIWKIYIPMWPATYFQLRHRYSRFPDASEIMRIGPLDEGELFKLRSNKAQELIRQSDKKITVHDDIYHNDVILKSDELSLYAHFGRKEAPLAFRSLVQSLSGHSTHRELLLWMDVFSSLTLERHYLRERQRRLISAEGGFLANTKASPFEFITSYAWSDALCAGLSNYHHRLGSRVPNIFYTVKEVRNCFDVLVGAHILFMMNRKGARRKDTLVTYLCPFGYTTEQIEESLEYLRQKHLFEWFWGDRMDFDLYPGMGAAYCNLITNPAYLDNIAITTPVKCERLSGMTLTRSDNAAHFVARARTTICFMEQIQADEDEFCSWRLGRGNCSFEEFKTKFDAAQFPSVFDRMACAYKWRLQFLQREKFLANTVSLSDWDYLFGKPIFTNIPDLPDEGGKVLPWRYLLAKDAT